MMATKKVRRVNSSKPTIKPSKHLVDTGLAEIYQDMGITMALLTRQSQTEYTRITPYVKCRDFLVDVYSYSKAKKTFAIYGMSFDPTKELPAEDGVYLAMIFPNEKAEEAFKTALPQLHAIELANEMEVTEFYPGVEGKVSLLTGSKKWLRNCLTFSLYTALIRCLSYGVGDNWLASMKKEFSKKTDGRLVSSVADETWERILADLKTIEVKQFCGFDPNKDSVGTIHHNSGFFSVFGSHRELSQDAVRTNTHWKHFREQGWKLHTN